RRFFLLYTWPDTRTPALLLRPCTALKLLSLGGLIRDNSLPWSLALPVFLDIGGCNRRILFLLLYRQLDLIDDLETFEPVRFGLDQLLLWLFFLGRFSRYGRGCSFNRLHCWRSLLD